MPKYQVTLALTVDAPQPTPSRSPDPYYGGYGYAQSSYPQGQTYNKVVEAEKYAITQDKSLAFHAGDDCVALFPAGEWKGVEVIAEAVETPLTEEGFERLMAKRDTRQSANTSSRPESAADAIKRLVKPRFLK